MHIKHWQCQNRNRRNWAGVWHGSLHQLNFFDYGLGIADDWYASQMTALWPHASGKTVFVCGPKKHWTTWGFCLDCRRLAVNMKASDLHMKQGWVIDTLLKRAHGCRVISHKAYQTSAMPKSYSQKLSWYVTWVTTSAWFLWLWSWHCWWLICITHDSTVTTC